MNCEEELVRDHKLEFLKRAINLKLEAENRRVRDAREVKSTPTVYKTEAELF